MNRNFPSAATLLLSILLAGCLAGPSSALGGGPIGRAPNLDEMALLPEPDSTRGVSFVLVSNRRDLLAETRVEMNGAARAFERLLGTRPEDADIRLTSDDRDVHVALRIGTRPATTFSVSLGRDEGGRARAPEAVRVAAIVVLAMSREWLSGFARALVPGDTAPAAWMARSQLPVWLRIGVLQGVAEHPLHEVWIAQLARQRDSLPSVADLLSDRACDVSCLAPFSRNGFFGLGNGADSTGALDIEAPSPGGRPGVRRGRLPLLQGRLRSVASLYALVQFMSKREGPEYMRALIAAALAGGDMKSALGSARSFTADPADIDRQWRVWLASYAYPDR